jgi:hypothetical protein
VNETVWAERKKACRGGRRVGLLKRLFCFLAPPSFCLFQQKASSSSSGCIRLGLGARRRYV